MGSFWKLFAVPWGLPGASRSAKQGTLAWDQTPSHMFGALVVVLDALLLASLRLYFFDVAFYLISESLGVHVGLFWRLFGVLVRNRFPRRFGTLLGSDLGPNLGPQTAPKASRAGSRNEVRC